MATPVFSTALAMPALTPALRNVIVSRLMFMKGSFDLPHHQAQATQSAIEWLQALQFEDIEGVDEEDVWRAVFRGQGGNRQWRRRH